MPMSPRLLRTRSAGRPWSPAKYDEGLIAAVNPVKYGAAQYNTDSVIPPTNSQQVAQILDKTGLTSGWRYDPHEANYSATDLGGYPCLNLNPAQPDAYSWNAGLAVLNADFIIAWVDNQDVVDLGTAYPTVFSSDNSGQSIIALYKSASQGHVTFSGENYYNADFLATIHGSPIVRLFWLSGATLKYYENGVLQAGTIPDFSSGMQIHYLGQDNSNGLASGPGDPWNGYFGGFFIVDGAAYNSFTGNVLNASDVTAISNYLNYGRAFY